MTVAKSICERNEAWEGVECTTQNMCSEGRTVLYLLILAHPNQSLLSSSDKQGDELNIEAWNNGKGLFLQKTPWLIQKRVLSLAVWPPEGGCRVCEKQGSVATQNAHLFFRSCHTVIWSSHLKPFCQSHTGSGPWGVSVRTAAWP